MVRPPPWSAARRDTPPRLQQSATQPAWLRTQPDACASIRPDATPPAVRVSSRDQLPSAAAMVETTVEREACEAREHEAEVAS
jgi:hypothetical protein